MRTLALLALVACSARPSADMVAVAGATLAMGCDPARDPSCADTEQPQHAVAVAGFRIDRLECSERAYAACVEAGACTRPRGALDPASERPVVHVTWEQARAHCRWRGARLPTEAEWELAARGTDGRRFPWGDANPTCAQAHVDSCGPGPVAVGGRPDGASPCGALDLAGNVDEWVEDGYAPYGGTPTSGDKVARGGAYDAWHSRTTARSSLAADFHDGLLGFRCASTPE